MEENETHIELPSISKNIAEDLESTQLEKGIKQGVLKVASKMIEKDMDLKLICDLTGYSLEKTKKLKKYLGKRKR